MPDIHLFIPDPALHAAILEQLGSAKLGELREGGLAGWRAEELSVLILDEEAATQKLGEALSQIPSPEKRRVFILGEANPHFSDDLVTEILPKPLRLGYFLARVQFHLQAATRLRGTAVDFGGWRFEPQNRQIIKLETRTVVRLTEKETALLDYLAQSQSPVGREELLAAVWGYDERMDTHTLETHMYQLRRKLDPEGADESWLVNEQGSYRLRRKADVA